MYPLAIGLFSGIVLALSLYLGKASNGHWSVVWGIVLAVMVNAAFGIVMKKKISAIMERVQGIMRDGQKKIQEKTNSWRFRPPGSIKQAKLDIEKMQHVLISSAIAAIDPLRRYEKWSPFLSRQIATMEMHFHFQDKNFKEVDSRLGKCLFLDPMTSAMAMARVYSRDGYKHVADKKGRKRPNEIDKYFSRAVSRLRYGQGALIYGLMAWIFVKENKVDEAFDLLLKADRKMDNATIKHNIGLLKNNKPKQFSLAGLGDEWYALGLEEPRIRMQSMPQKPF